jgi:hypothetical protein
VLGTFFFLDVMWCFLKEYEDWSRFAQSCPRVQV